MYVHMYCLISCERITSLLSLVYYENSVKEATLSIKSELKTVFIQSIQLTHT